MRLEETITHEIVLSTLYITISNSENVGKTHKMAIKTLKDWCLKNYNENNFKFVLDGFYCGFRFWWNYQEEATQKHMLKRFVKEKLKTNKNDSTRRNTSKD